METPARPPPGRQVRLIVGAMWTFAPLDSSHITEHYERDGVLVDFGWKTVRARARVRNSTDNRDLRRTAAKFAGANIISIAVYRGSRGICWALGWFESVDRYISVMFLDL